jgi:protein-tyrosine phosphatase
MASVVYRFPDHDKPPGDIVRLIKSGKLGPEQARLTMIELYQDLPYLFRKAYRELFLHLANADLPLVFNCAAGKDRTGVAAALVLTTLGVRHEAVMEDYVMTELSFERSCELLLNDERVSMFEGIERAAWEPLMRADPEYLQAMFDHLRGTHGGVENFVATELGISPGEREQIRSNLLE